MGADDKEDSDAPVGTVSVCVVLWDVAARAGGRVGFVSAKVDCADSGRGGRFWEAAIRLF